MITIGDIASEIVRLNNLIIEYEKCIYDLENNKSSVRDKQYELEVFLYDRLREYDVSRNEFWEGKRAAEAFEHHSNCTELVLSAMDESEELVYDINNAIDNYRNMISDCREKIERLQEQLACLQKE